MKFLVEEILNKRWIFKFNYSKTPKKASDFLTKDEIIKLFNSIKNKKHRLMIALMYSAGLRVSELVNLRIKDLDFEHCFGWIRNGKGNKDRLFIIAERLRYDLINFVKDNKIEYNDFLFKGNSYGHLSVCTIRMILKKAKRLARINKNIHPHALRHSFATHLMENRNDILAAQSLLGHSRVDTTMGYVHNDYPIIVNVKSPYDLL
jgi:site-specific recombinase XerD